MMIVLLSVTAQGGVAPYTTTIVKAADQALNMSGITEQTQWTNTNQAGAAFISQFALDTQLQ